MQEIIKKKILGTSDTWSMNRSSQQPSNDMTQHIILKIPKLYSIWYVLASILRAFYMTVWNCCTIQKPPDLYLFVTCDLGKWLFVQDSSIFFDPALENVYIIAFWPQTPKHNKYKEGEGGKDVVLSMNSNYYFLILYPRVGVIFHFFFGSRYKVDIWGFWHVLTCFDRNWQV